jgi:hypothetical protein
VLSGGLFILGCAGSPAPGRAAGEKQPPRGFSVTGEWNYSGLSGYAPDKSTLYSNKIGATATWNPGTTSVGPVRISFHVVAHEGGNDPNVKIEIVHSGKTDIKYVDTSQGESLWAELGIFDFVGKGDEYVRLVKVTEKTNTRVSALKFEILDARRPDFVWQTLVLDNPVPYNVATLRWEASPEERIRSVKGGPPDPAKWEITFSDDFNGDKLNWDVWQSSKNETWGRLLSSRWPENAVVTDGLLRLMTRKGKRGGKEWTSAFIWTKSFKQKYGYWEARCRYAGASGLNNAFWMHPGKAKKGEGFEIDVNEGHYPDVVNMTLHQDGLPSNSESWHAGMDLSKDFHVYAVAWNEKELTYYFDGREVDRKPNAKAHLEVPVMFSTAVITWAGPVTDALDGKSMDVDWVRVYRRKDER